MRVTKMKENDENVARNYMNTLKVYDYRVSNDADFFAKYCKIEGMNFVIWGMGHLKKRGLERGGLASTEYWVERFVELLTEDEDVFWDVTGYKEVIIADKVQNRAYAACLRPVNVNGVVFNEIYIKTMLKTNETKSGVFYVGDTPIVSFDRSTGEVSDTL